jgi:tetratricopeptide (TPR) repeat protein
MKLLRILLGITIFALLSQSAPAQTEHETEHEHAPSTSGNKATDFLWEQSDKAFHDGDYERAITCHKAIVAIDPSDVQSFGVAAWLMWSMGKKDEAMAHIARGLKANPDDWDMWDEAGQHYQLEAGMRDPNPELLRKAKDAFVHAVELLPKDVDKNDEQMLRRRLAHAAEKSGDYDLALATWKKLVEDYPDEAVNKNNLARVEKTIADKANEKTHTTAAYGASGAAFLAFVGAGAISKKLAKA